MRQILIAGRHEIRVRETALPEPAAGELRVRAEAVGICGSDLHALRDEHPFVELPVVPGHEAAGVVDAVGTGVTEFAPGDRVLLEPNLVDGTCHYCTTGRYNLCEHLRVVGCQGPGALADAFVAPAGRFHAIPAGMSFAAAALVEPLSTATHALRTAGGVRDATVAVLGGGSIGLLVMLACRARGARAVAVTDPIADKRELATALGADLAVDPTEPDAVSRIRTTLPWRPDVVFDCVSSQSSVDQAIALALKGGTIVVTGVPVGAVTIPLALVQDRELALRGTAMYVAADVAEAIELIGSGQVPVDALVSARYPLAEAGEAFRVAAEGLGDRPAIKVQIDAQR